jgi:hypothetical protein
MGDNWARLQAYTAINKIAFIIKSKIYDTN